MGFDLSALTPWVEENAAKLIVKAVLKPKTVDRIKAKGNVITGVKGPETLPTMDTDAILQDGEGCGFNAAGTTKFGKRQIDAKKVKVQEEFCPTDVEKYVLRQRLTAGSDQEDIVFHKEYVDLKLAKVAAQIEKLVWLGDTASSDVSMKRINGFVKIIDGSSDKINGNTGAVTSLTVANIDDVIDHMVDALPASFMEQTDISIACDPVILKLYTRMLKKQGVYLDFKEKEAADELAIPGTNVTLYSTPGLAGTNRMFGFSFSNLYYATDLEGESEEIKMWYSNDSELVRFSTRFRIGVQIGDTSEIVSFKLAPVAP